MGNDENGLETSQGSRRVAVTGGSGHFGQLVVERLLERPEIGSVLSLDIVPPRLEHDKLEGRVADISDPQIGRLFEGVDTVVHLAFLIGSHLPRERYEAINVEGSKNVFRGARQAGVKQIVYASSVAAYGLVRDHPVPITEDTPRVHQPDFAYNDAKFRVEAFLDDFEAEHPELTITRMRMVTALGPGQKSAIGRMLARGYVPSTSDVPWSIIWEDDVADALVLAVEKRAAGAFNLSTEESMSGADLAKATGMKSLRFPRFLGVALGNLTVLGWKLGLVKKATDPSWFRYSDAVLVLSSERAVRELGWKRRYETAVEVLRAVRETVTQG